MPRNESFWHRSPWKSGKINYLWLVLIKVHFDLEAKPLQMSDGCRATTLNGVPRDRE